MKDKSFVESFEHAHFISPGRAVSAIIARVGERRDAGYDLPRCFEETVQELNGHAVEITDILQQARIGLGLETDNAGQAGYDIEMEKASRETAPQNRAGPS